MTRIATAGTALALAAAVVGSATPAFAVFHFMQIEEVIAGVDGDTTAQAIQFRMRGPGQNLTTNSRLVLVDATGANPVLLENLTANVANGALGDRVLLATAAFSAHTVPAAVPDFVLDAPIPASYLAAGSMTYDNDTSTIKYWRLSWGGAGYTGATTGATTNDADGQFAPNYADPLPSSDGRAVHFIGTASAPSTNNAADYALTSTAAVFINNAGNTFTVQTVTDAPVVAAGADQLVRDLRVMPNPFSTSTSIDFQLARRVDARLVIVDTLGRRVHEWSRSLPAGGASISWDGRNGSGSALASGVYFYRLEIENDVRNGQLILIR